MRRGRAAAPIGTKHGRLALRRGRRSGRNVLAFTASAGQHGANATRPFRTGGLEV